MDDDFGDHMVFGHSEPVEQHQKQWQRLWPKEAVAQELLQELTMEIR